MLVSVCDAAEIFGRVRQECWSECDGKEEVVAVSKDTPKLMARLKARDIKIAVCTSDARVPTLANLESLGIASCVGEPSVYLLGSLLAKSPR